jgi:hypothetical protein
MPVETTVRLKRDFPSVLRLILGAIGALVISVPAIELWPTLWPLGWHSLLLGFILAGAAAIGGLLLVSAIVGEETVWTLNDAALEIQRRTIFGIRRDTLSGGDIAAVSVHEHEWESRPSSFAIAVRLRTGPRLISPDCKDRAQAEALGDILRERFGVKP